MTETHANPILGRRSTLQVLALGMFLTVAAAARPQGCSQCRETLGATSVRNQTAYRRAIVLMTAAGSTVFLASISALKRFR